MKKRKKKKEYALYRGDTFLAIGDIGRLHEITGVSERTLYAHKANGDKYPYEKRYILGEVGRVRERPEFTPYTGETSSLT